MSVLAYSSPETIADSANITRAIFYTGKTRSIAFRKTQIQRLHDLVFDNQERIYQALEKDLRKPRAEALGGDIAPILNECTWFLENLDRLVKDEKVKPRMGSNAMDKAVIRKDPLGTVLIIGAWNYPVQLPLLPLVGAIAGGNTAVIKPSELAVHTAALLTELIPKYLDHQCYRVVNGGPGETSDLLKYHFDHIFYTGSGNVGKIVMKAAAEHLTGVTLELGGKSPAIVLSDADLQVTANRIAFGKFFNAGQTCIAVDYVLVPEALTDKLVDALKKTVKSMFGNNPKNSKDYARIVSTRHLDRIVGLVENRKSGNVVLGGDYDRDDSYIAPTIIRDVKFNDEVLMGDEIFGPILPIVSYADLDGAIHLVAKGAPPLAMYVFTGKKALAQKVLESTQSGGVCVNDCLMHQAEYALPFGGVGSSGLGNYHGDRSFRTFTHERSVLAKTLGKEKVNAVRYPPYSDRKFSVMQVVMGTHPTLLKLKALRGKVKFGTLVLVLAYIVFKLKRA